MNAIANAIGGDAHKLDMPLTPEKVWRACRENGIEQLSCAGSTRASIGISAAFQWSRGLRCSLRAVGGGDHHVEGVAFAIERERHVDAGGAERPDFAVELALRLRPARPSPR